MRTSILILLVFISSISAAQSNLPTIHGLDATTITGDTISLSQYAGKKLMIVNTASYCGYTPQFADLQQLYALYSQSNDFEIIGFPCNDFAGQDPLTDSATLSFCTSNYNVTFQMMSHIHINTGLISPVYQWLKSQSLNGVSNATVTWNFNKFLIDEAGHWIQHYTQTTSPSDIAIVDWITTPSVFTSISTHAKGNMDITLSNFGDYYLATNLGMLAYVQITGMDGRVLLSENVMGNSFEINKSMFNSGIYVLKVNRGSQWDVIKFTID
jgi:glutathione peroxidase